MLTLFWLPKINKTQRETRNITSNKKHLPLKLYTKPQKNILSLEHIFSRLSSY